MWIRFSQSAQESADSTSDCTQDCERWAESLERCAWWRGKHSPARSWEKRLKKGGWMTRLSGSEICATYPFTNFRPSTGTPEAIPASPSAKQADGWEETTLVICGPSSSDSSSLFDQEESSSRMCQGISRSASIASFKTWRDAVSAVRSDCLQRRKSAHLTDESGSSSLAWPTATTGDSRSSGRHTTQTGVSHTGTTLTDAVRMWPTATSRDWKGTYVTLTRKDGRKRGDLLPDAVEIEAGLPDQVDRKTHGSRRALSPLWVESLMGFPIGWTDCER